MTRTRTGLMASAVFIGVFLLAEPAGESPAPTIDRVGFPASYEQQYQVLRVVDRKDEQKVVTVYGNDLAASVTRTNDLPYPYGSILVMETAGALMDPAGKPAVDDRGRFRRDKVLGLHVMKRGKGFGEAYREKRSGEWEFVEFKADGSYLTPPQKSAACAECHIKAGPERDFVYRGRLGDDSGR